MSYRLWPSDMEKNKQCKKVQKNSKNNKDKIWEYTNSEIWKILVWTQKCKIFNSNKTKNFLNFRLNFYIF